MTSVFPERDWEPPRPPFAYDQIVGLRIAFAKGAIRDRVKRAGGHGIQREGSGNYATIRWSRSA